MLTPVDAHVVDQPFWDECARSGVSKVRRSAAAASFGDMHLHERLASMTQEDAFFALLPYLERVVQAAGQPTRLEQELAGMNNSEELKTVALRLGVPVPVGRGFRRQTLSEAILVAVAAFAAQHPREAAAALGAPARSMESPPKARDAAADKQLPPGGADALNALAARMARPSPRRTSRSAARLGAATPPAKSAARVASVRKDAPRRRRRDSSPSSSSSSSSSPSASSEASASDSESVSSSSSSSSESDSSSSGGGRVRRARPRRRKESRRHRRASSRIRDEMERIGVDDPIANEVIENILRGRSSDAYVAEVIASRTYKQLRNRNELLLLARIIDCLRERRYDAALELACRRLSGVQLADSSNTWNMADALLQNTESAADLPDSVLRRVLKSAANMTSLSQSSSKSASSSSSSRAARPSSSSNYRTGSSQQSREGQRGPPSRSNKGKSTTGGAPAKKGAGDE